MRVGRLAPLAIVIFTLRGSAVAHDGEPTGTQSALPRMRSRPALEREISKIYLEAAEAKVAQKEGRAAEAGKPSATSSTA